VSRCKPQRRERLLSFFCNILQKYISSSVYISVNGGFARCTIKDLWTAQIWLDDSTTSTCFAGVFLSADDDLEPRVLAGFMEQTLAKTVMWPGQHLSCCFRVDFSRTAFFNHVLCLNSGSKTIWWFSHNHLANLLWHSSTRLRIFLWIRSMHRWSLYRLRLFVLPWIESLSPWILS